MAGSTVPEEDWTAAVAAFHALPAGASVLLVCHVNPDGDALGSMLGFGLGLRRLGVPAQATFPGPFTLAPPFDQLPGLDLLIPSSAAPAAPDLLVCFDAASEGRLGELINRLETAGTSIVLDHHASNTGFGAIHVVDPTAAATSVVVAGLLDRLGVAFDAEIAECLYVALSTDTGSFKFDLTTPAVHTLAARLLATGIRPAEISRRLFDSRPFGAMKLYGDVLARATLEPESGSGGLVWSYATLADLARHGQGAHVLEGLIDAVRVVEEADVACVLKQAGPREWGVSLRSKGAVDVAAVAVALGGGGHRLAAGFTGRGTLEDVIESVRAAL
ncbi:MAG TPA: DHH family phosphoesterase [Rugosimonospora sp.]|nr:DHH family phosphoesterase [Rugosimonospora sp.]